MKNSWMMWVLIVGIFIGVLVILNYQGAKSTMPLSEVFKDDKSRPNDIEYEFITNNAQNNQTAPSTTASDTTKTKPATTASLAPAASSTSAPSGLALAPVAAPTSATSKDMKKVPFTIQVSSFRDRTKADKIIDTLTQKGYNPYVVSMDLGDKGTWYRIYVGKYDTKAQAEEVLVKIKEEYKSSFIIAPRTK